MELEEMEKRFNRLASAQTKALAEGVAYVLAAMIKRTNDGLMVIDDLKSVLEEPLLRDNPVAGFLLSEVVRHLDGIERQH